MRALVAEDEPLLADSLHRKLGDPPVIETWPGAGYRIGS